MESKVHAKHSRKKKKMPHLVSFVGRHGARVKIIIRDQHICRNSKGVHWDAVQADNELRNIENLGSYKILARGESSLIKVNKILPISVEIEGDQIRTANNETTNMMKSNVVVGALFSLAD